MNDADDPAKALASIREARTAMTEKNFRYPLAYDLAYGACCGLLVAGQGLPQPYAVMTVPLGLIGLAVMVHWWKEKFGFWVDGFQPKRARWAAIGLGLVMVAAMLTNVAGRQLGWPWWVPLATGGVAFVAAIVGGRLWMRLYRRELAETVE
jgi:hypothetical protein